MRLMERANRLIDEYDLLPGPGGLVLAAVSGGADSVCLLDWLYHVRDIRGFRLAAAHYNHNLRGDESRRDQAFVQTLLADQYPEIALFVGAGDVAAQAKRAGRGLEDMGRELRYAFLQKTLRDLGGGVIATAHNADDNVETVLLRLLRGSGLRGLTGIPPKRDGIIRPLLTTTRAEILEYLRVYGLAHVEDSSNADDAFSRNHLRKNIIPLLREIDPWLEERVGETVAVLRREDAYLDELARQRVTHSVPELRALPEALLPRVLQLLAQQASPGVVLTLEQRRAAAALVFGESPSAQISLPGHLTARREYHSLLFEVQTQARPWAPVPLELGANPAGDCVLQVSLWTYQGEKPGKDCFYLPVGDYAARPRKTGDVLKRPGRPARTVKKLMIDEKIPRPRRDRLPVLETEGRLAAAAELGQDEHFLPQTGEICWKIEI